MPNMTRSKRPVHVSPGKLSGVMMPTNPPMPCCKSEMPTKIRPKPATAKPAEEARPPAKRRMSTPTNTIGNAAVPSSSLKPSSATSQPVTVVPTFAPRTMPSA